jgi:uncharacterized protein
MFVAMPGSRAIWIYLWSFDQAPSLLEFIHMEDELSEKLGIKVDLVMKRALKTHIGRRILAEVIPI